MTPFSLREICCHATTGGEQINALWCNGMSPRPNEGRAHAIASVITMMRDSRAFLRNGKKGMTMTLRYSFAGAVAFTVLATAAGAADMQPVLKAPGAQPEQATGYVEVYSGWGSTKNTVCFTFEDGCETFKANGWALGGAARGNYWIARDVSVQVDAQAEGTSNDCSNCSGHFSTHSYLVGGHWSWRNPQQYLFGLFAAAGDAGGDGVTFDSQRHGLIGAEAQWYWNQF